MINRTTIKNSRYEILNDDPKQIRDYIKQEQEKSAKEKEKELKNHKTKIEDINLQENYDNQDQEGSNNIVVYTRKDNLTHNYFFHFELYWDAGDCMSSVILKMPKTDTGNTQYWITYTGEVEIYTGNNIDQQIQETTDDNNTNTTTAYWDLQGLSPIFRGEVGRIKEYHDVLEIHIDSIGKRFKQKIPDTFRQSFINNQNVRDAFQAICEFLGVKYICPPSNSTEDTLTDGTEADATSQLERQTQAATQAAAQMGAETISDKNTPGDSEKNTNPDQSSTDVDQAGQNTDSNALDQNTATGDQENVTDVQTNGYADISFDAGGAIVHGSVTIESSPNMIDTLIEMDEHPLDKYLEDTTYVATDVKKFLEGEFFETVHNNVMNYGAITIEPKSASSTEMSNLSGTTTPTTGEEDTGEEGTGEGTAETGGGGTASSSSGSSPRGYNSSGLPAGVGRTALGSYYFTKERINNMSPAEASRIYQGAKGKNIYTSATMSKLLQRSFGVKLF